MKSIFYYIFLFTLHINTWAQAPAFVNGDLWQAPPPNDNIQAPPSVSELKKIKQITELIKTGKIRNWDWSTDGYITRLDARPVFNELTLGAFFENYNFRQWPGPCPSYVHENVSYGCLEAPGNHLGEEFSTFLTNSGLDRRSPLNLRSHEDAKILLSNSQIDVHKFTASTGANGQDVERKLTQISVELRRNEDKAPPLAPALLDYTHGKIPKFNLEKFPIKQSDAFAYIETSNSAYRYLKPCRFNAILKGKCMPGGGVLRFNYLFYGE